MAIDAIHTNIQTNKFFNINSLNNPRCPQISTENLKHLKKFVPPIQINPSDIKSKKPLVNTSSEKIKNLDPSSRKKNVIDAMIEYYEKILELMHEEKIQTKNFINNTIIKIEFDYTNVAGQMRNKQVKYTIGNAPAFLGLLNFIVQNENAKKIFKIISDGAANLPQTLITENDAKITIFNGEKSINEITLRMDMEEVSKIEGNANRINELIQLIIRNSQIS